MSTLKDIGRGIGKAFSNQKIILLLIFLVVAWILLAFTGKSGMRYDGMTSYSPDSSLSPAPVNGGNSISNPSGSVADGAAPIKDSGAYVPIATANPSDLLPNDVNSAWSSLNPSNQGDIRNPDLLQAGYHIGIDTIGQTLRIPNLQLRSDPIIAKQNVGPWNQAPDVDPDYGRIPLDPGCSA